MMRASWYVSLLRVYTARASSARLLDARGVLRHEPIAEIGQASAESVGGQIEDASGDVSKAAGAAEAALPLLTSVAVNQIVVGDLLALLERPSPHHAPLVADPSNVRVRLAARVDVALG
jgi:hypothetical protein